MQAVEEDLVDQVFEGETDRLAPDEAAAVRYAERMWAQRGDLTDEEFAELRRHFDDAQVVELSFAVGAFISLGQMIKAFAIPK